VNESHYIDENDLPFTEDELFRALALTGDERLARDAAQDMAELLSSGTYEGAWSIGDEVFAALALLSDDLRERVEAYMRLRWEGMRSSLGDDELARYVAEWRTGSAALAEWVRRRQAGEPVGDEPPPWPGLDNG
jgi:hypothetical protein